ncbi:hypothetical protein RDMS_07460 [Deinococcus sp. RL]|nr:hypothetical protein RDMS_07460 [Deinococcus sp. RL]
MLPKAGQGRNYRDFDLSDLLGKLGEYVWAQFLRLRGHELLEGPRGGHFPDYDLKACWRGQPYTYEVKTDWHSKETGNIPIELGETPNG